MFPCSSCGLCCENISLVKELYEFDLGNGVCKHLNLETKLCEIYSTRPNVCNIDISYKDKYNKVFTKYEFYFENAKVCNELQEINCADTKYKINIGE